MGLDLGELFGLVGTLRWPFVGLVARGGGREVVVGLVGVLVVEAVVEVAGLAEWREGYKVGLERRGLRYS